MPQIISNGLGLEEIVDAFGLAIIEGINDALAVVYERRQLLDQEIADARGIDFLPIEYDDIAADHIHIGNFPSMALEEVPVEDYPYVAITLEDYSPDSEDALQDHMSVTRDAIVVHCLTQASQDEGSEIVFRRSCRLAEAVFITIGSNSTTSRMISGLSNPIRGRPSIPWRYQHEGYGENFWFQAVGTQYQIKSYTSVYQ